MFEYFQCDDNPWHDEANKLSWVSVPWFGPMIVQYMSVYFFAIKDTEVEVEADSPKGFGPMIVQYMSVYFFAIKDTEVEVEADSPKL